MAFLLREKKSGVKLPGYLLMMGLIAFSVPPHVKYEMQNTGRRMAQAWAQQIGLLAPDEKDRYPALRFTVINEAEAIVFSDVPPATLFISARKERPSCVGQPQSVAQACQENLEYLLRTSMHDLATEQ
jgi:hypothetical protein